MRPVAPILVFDGHCSFCSSQVRFILRHEREPRLRFATTTSAIGRRLLSEHGVDPDDPSTFLLVRDGEALTRSSAVLAVAGMLRAPWRWLRALGVLPERFLDRLYDYIARNRYRWWGREADCMRPPDGQAHRFLDIEAGPTHD